MSLIIGVAIAGIGCFEIQEKDISLPKEGEEEATSPTFQPVHPTRRVPAAPNRCKVVAEVVGVERFEYPRFELTLQIKEIKDIPGYKNFLKSRKAIKVYPQFIIDYDGSILMSLPQNVELAEAYYLSIGKKIEAEITYRGDERGGSWNIINWREVKEEK